jgi:predicted Zn-ribbon and HTH transcriptional regulator
MGEENDLKRLSQTIGVDPAKTDAQERLLALAWRCNQCGYVSNSKTPVRMPVPCVQCGGAIFRVVNR